MTRLLPAILLAVLLLALPAGASAATFTVTTGAELVTALDTADTNDQDDTITIAAGATPLTNPAGYAYNAGLTDEDNDLVINAQGRAIKGSDPTVILLSNLFGPGEMTVNDLHVEMQAGNTTGLDLQTRATLSNLEVSGTGDAGSSGLRTHRAVQATGVTISSATQQGVMVEGDVATFTDLDVSGSTLRMVYSYGTVNITGGTFHDPAPGFVLGVVTEGTGTQATLRRVRMSGLYRPAVATYSGTMTVTDSLLSLPAGAGAAVVATDSGSTGANTSTAVGERLTIVGTDDPLQVVAVAEGGSASEQDQMRVTLRDSIVTGVPNGVSCEENNAQSVNAITLDRVNQAPATTDVNTCDGSQLSGVARTAVTSLDPGFVNAAGGDYRLRTDSLLLDVGPAATALPGLPAKDLDGVARLNDGDGDCTPELDLGAYETQAAVFAACLPPVPAAPAGGGAPVVPIAAPAAPDRTAPVLSKLKVSKTIRRATKPPVTIRLRLSEAATVKLAFRRVKGKRFVTVPGAITLKLAAGDNAVRFAGRLSRTRQLGAGSYQVVVTATDAAGNRGGAQRATFRISA